MINLQWHNQRLKLTEKAVSLSPREEKIFREIASSAARIVYTELAARRRRLIRVPLGYTLLTVYKFMALLAEEIVEEWLNRNGYFTIRGIKIGVNEIDLLAIKINGSKIEARHIEVQASSNPISYLCPLSKRLRKKTGRSPQSTKLRSVKEVEESVNEWLEKKYYQKKKQNLRDMLFSGS